MHEMLGHLHFMSKDYDTALVHYEKVVRGGNASTEIRKRAIICYVRARRITEAISLFERLIVDDIECVVKHNQDSYGCPCPEIIDEYERSLNANAVTQDDRIALGILWLFCSLPRSLEIFAEALHRDPGRPFLKSVMKLLTTRSATTPAIFHQSLDRERHYEQ